MTKPVASTVTTQANQTNQSPPNVTEQKCNYCAGTGKWNKDIFPGKPPESVNCPHCHGSGKIGHGTIERVAPEEQ
jgi:DnaJ-class molecular chaperone